MINITRSHESVPQIVIRCDRSASDRCRLLPLVVLLFVLLPVTAPAAGADRSAGILTTVGGDRFAGGLLPSEDGQRVLWQPAELLDPLAFRLESIRLIEFEPPKVAAKAGSFVVHCVGGDVLAGELVGWDSETLTLRSDSLGELAIRLSAISHLHRSQLDDKTSVVLATRLADWRNTSWDTAGWTQSGGQLISSRAGTALNGDFGLPQRLIMDLELTWSGDPDFVVALACDPAAEQDSGTDGWRLETAGMELMAIRELSQSAQVETVTELSRGGGIRLIIHLDQIKGHFRVQPGHQSQPIEIIDSAEASPRTGLRISDRRGGLVVRRLQVVPWSGDWGKRPSQSMVRLKLKNGHAISAAVSKLKADKLLLASPEHRKRIELPVSDLMLANFPRPIAGERLPGTTFELINGLRITGEIVHISDDGWLVTANHLVSNVTLPHRFVRQVAVQPDSGEAHQSDRSDPTLDLGAVGDDLRLGRLELSTTSSHGWLGESTDPETVVWQPLASLTESRLRAGVSGRIVYRVRERGYAATTRRDSHATFAPTRSRKSFGDLFLDRVGQIRGGRARRDQHRLHLRCGDVLQCRFDAIDESGVYVSTAHQDAVLVRHADVKAIELVSSAALPDLDEAEREQLLTVPRRQSISPPTHLLCSHDGDYLRCQIVAAEAGSFVVKVQRQSLQIPRERITHLIWLTGDETSAAGALHQPNPSHLQLVATDGSRITMRPTALDELTLHGMNLLRQSVAVDLTELDRILLGQSIADEARELIYADWVLKPAIAPRIRRADEAGENQRIVSPLVGRAAPEIDLPRLDGGGFQLSKWTGKIVVLDFWASWCAPCMQTMAALHARIRQIAPGKVILVAVNVSERPAAVRDAIDRLKLETLVALDGRGTAAKLFAAQAIPYTVVIDTTGKVAGVFRGRNDATTVELEKIVRQLAGENP